jgi:hypothetical protein
MSTITRQSVDESHQRFAVITWLHLWFYSWIMKRENFVKEQYLSMVGKLLECDLEACFLKALINRHRDLEYASILSAKYFYTPGRINFIVPPFSRELYDSNDLVRQAVSRIVTSAEDTFAVLISGSQISTTIDVHFPTQVFVLRLEQYMAELDEHVKGSNKVIQALKRLRREKRMPFDYLVERLVMVGDPDDSEMNRRVKSVISSIRAICYDVGT